MTTIPPTQKISNGILYAAIGLVAFLVLTFSVILVIADETDASQFAQLLATVFTVVGGFLGVMAKLQSTQEHAETAARTIADLPDALEKRLAAFADQLAAHEARLQNVPCLDSGTPGVECAPYLAQHRKVS